MQKRFPFILLHQTPTLTSIHIKAINIQPSVIGYIAKGIAHVGNGEKDKGYRACDIAFERFHSSHVTFLLLIKVCSVGFSGLCMLILLRPSLCLWPESMLMRYRAWTI